MNDRRDEGGPDISKSLKVLDGIATGAAAGVVAGPQGAAIGAAAGGGKALLDVLIAMLRNTPNARLEEADQIDLREYVRSRDQARMLEGYRDRLEEKIDRLLKSTEETADFASNAMAIFEAWRDAWKRTADSKKRRLIMAALVNSFDKSAYEEGLTLRLFDILEDLDYGELWVLCHAFEGSSLIRGPLKAVHEPRSMQRYHVERLRAYQLLHIPEDDPALGERWYVRLRLTDLGVKMQALVNDEALKASGGT